MDTPTLVCQCGSDEFVTQPNAYDVYAVRDGKLELTRREFTDEEDGYFCRRCGEEYKGKSLL